MDLIGLNFNVKGMRKQEEILIIKKCSGCGIELQFEDKNKEGYVPEEKFITQDNLLCQRCFKIKNYEMTKNKINNSFFQCVIKYNFNFEAVLFLFAGKL